MQFRVSHNQAYTSNFTTVQALMSTYSFYVSTTTNAVIKFGCIMTINTTLLFWGKLPLVLNSARLKPSKCQLTNSSWGNILEFYDVNIYLFMVCSILSLLQHWLFVAFDLIATYIIFARWKSIRSLILCLSTFENVIERLTSKKGNLTQHVCYGITFDKTEMCDNELRWRWRKAGFLLPPLFFMWDFVLTG